MSRSYKLTLRLDPQTDADLLAWVERLRQQGYGVLSREVKAALRAWLGNGTPSPHRHAAMTLERDGLLVEIRQVVEAAVQSALGSGNLVVASTPPAETENQAAEEALEALGQSLLLDDDEET